MAEVKFNKGSEEWLMFMDFWNLCQKYWITEESDDYWNNFCNDTDKFCEKYKGILLARRLALAIIEVKELEHLKLKEQRKE